MYEILYLQITLQVVTLSQPKMEGRELFLGKEGGRLKMGLVQLCIVVS